MQTVIDELNSKLATASAHRQRIRADRDDARRRLYMANIEIKEQRKLLENVRPESRHAKSLFDEDDILNSVLKDFRNNTKIGEEESKVEMDDDPELLPAIVPQQEEESEEGFFFSMLLNVIEELSLPSLTTRDGIRRAVDLLEARKRFEPPTRLGTGLKNSITDDDIYK